MKRVENEKLLRPILIVILPAYGSCAQNNQIASVSWSDTG